MTDDCRRQREFLVEAAELPCTTTICSCADCQRFREDLAAMRGALRQARPVDLPAGFQARLRSRLRQAQAVGWEERSPTGAWQLGFRRWPLVLGTSLAAAVLLLALLLPTRLFHEKPLIVNHFHVGIHVAGAAPHAQLRVQLPPGLMLALPDDALAGTQELAWEEPLTPAGVHHLFALRAVGDGQWNLRVEARSEEEVASQSIRLSVQHGRVTVTPLAGLTPPDSGSLRLTLGPTLREAAKGGKG